MRAGSVEHRELAYIRHGTQIRGLKMRVERLERHAGLLDTLTDA